MGAALSLVICFAIITAYRAEQFTKRAEQLFPPVGEFITVDGVQVHYVKQGSGPALIMLHGAGGNLRDYTYGLLPRFAKNHTVIAFDRPGHGYSQNLPTDSATLDEQSNLLRKAAMQLGVKEAIVMGYSYGGALSLNMAVHNPEFVKGLVLISAVSMPWPYKIHINYRMMSKPVIGPALMAATTAYLGDDYFKSSYETVFTPLTPPTGYLEHVGVNLSVRYKSFVENSRQLNSLRPQIVDQSKSYSTLKMPIELIHGVSDPSVPIHVHAEEFIKVVQHANLTAIEGLGHGALQTYPQIEAAVNAVSMTQ
jgi:pimeloyl-ACP methyl ester carboxylesterase